MNALGLPVEYPAHEMLAMILPILNPMLHLTTPTVLANLSPKVKLKAGTV